MNRSRKIQRTAKQLLKRCIEGGKLNDHRILQIVDALIESKSRERFPVLNAFRALIRRYLRQHRAVVECAEPLSPEWQQRLEHDLRQQHPGDLEVAFLVNPDLIGGLRIKVADDIYDSTVRGKLAELERTFSGSQNDSRK